MHLETERGEVTSCAVRPELVARNADSSLERLLDRIPDVVDAHRMFLNWLRWDVP
jgi:hypothetical protein